MKSTFQILKDHNEPLDSKIPLRKRVDRPYYYEEVLDLMEKARVDSREIEEAILRVVRPQAELVEDLTLIVERQSKEIKRLKEKLKIYGEGE